MTRKSKTRTEVEMSSTTLSMLIDFYLGSMQRRGCTPDSVTSCQRALKQFYRYLSGGEDNGELMKLSGVTTERFGYFCLGRQGGGFSSALRNVWYSAYFIDSESSTRLRCASLLTWAM